MTHVIGVDLSYTATGIAWPDGQDTFCTSDQDGEPYERASTIAEHVGHYGDQADLIVIEAGVYLSHSAFMLGQLHGIVYNRLHGQRVLRVPPSNVKQYATGAGKAGKTEMIVAAREILGYRGLDDNEADAMWIRAVGLAMLGEPLADMPARNRKALTKLELPA